MQRSAVSTERPSEDRQPILRSVYDGQSKVNSDLASETGSNSEGDHRDVDRGTFEKRAEEQARQQRKIRAEFKNQTRGQAAAEIGR